MSTKEIYNLYVDIEVIMESYPIVFLYGTSLQVAITVLVIHTTVYTKYNICDSNIKRKDD